MDINEENQIDTDDVDVAGHGFKEVAVGLGAAGIVLGGVTAAAAAQSPAPGTMQGVHTVVGGAQDDVTEATPMLRWTSLAPPHLTKPQTIKPVPHQLNDLDYLEIDPAADVRAAADGDHGTHIQTPPPPPR